MERTHWKMAIVSICGVRLALMFGASVFSYGYKSPVRIKNWKAEPAR